MYEGKTTSFQSICTNTAVGNDLSKLNPSSVFGMPLPIIRSTYLKLPTKGRYILVYLVIFYNVPSPRGDQNRIFNLYKILFALNFWFIT